MNVSLLDAAIEKANGYISPNDFLCFLSYQLAEPIEDIVSFLLYNNFDELVCEYHIDKHYRIYSYDDINYEYKTTTLFREIAKDGFFYYMMFCHEFYDDCLEQDDTSLDFYEPIEIDFYYSIGELEKLPFIKELSLDLKNVSALNYTVYSDDTVKVEKQKDGKVFRLIELSSHSQADIFKAVIADKIPVPTIPQTDKELIAELQSEIADLKEQLNNQADAPADIEPLKGLNKRNVEKTLFISTAKAIADYVWSLDTSKAIRTGDMVQQIKAIMSKVDYELLPDEDDTIRTWLSEIAPPHAKRSGRTPSNAPKEITLTMKK